MDAQLTTFTLKGQLLKCGSNSVVNDLAKENAFFPVVLTGLVVVPFHF